MKKVLLTFGLFIGMMITGQAQVELKGFKLGSYYKGPQEILTTLGGIKGLLIVYQLEDNRIYRLQFIASEDTINMSKINDNDFFIIINGLQTKYGIEFLKDTDVESSNFWWDPYAKIYFLFADKDGVMYIIEVQHWEHKYSKRKIRVWIYNINLDKIFEEEEQAKKEEEQRKIENDF